MSRYASIWFPYLLIDYMVRKSPGLLHIPFVIVTPERGRMVIRAANRLAESQGILNGMVVADCRAILPELLVLDYEAGLAEKLLTAQAEWCIRYAPLVGTDLPDGLLLDISGCAHLWGGEKAYHAHIVERFNTFGYDTRCAIADTISAAWAMARFGKKAIVPVEEHLQALIPLPPAALRLEMNILERMKKLGLYRIGDFISMPRSVLRRRFGQELLERISKALGQQPEIIQPIQPVEPYVERLPALEPIRTRRGIEIALQQTLEILCQRLERESIGLRSCLFRAYRLDGNIQQIEITTGHPSRNVKHLFKLFEPKISTMKPDLGFELFVLEAPKVEPITIEQDVLWKISSQNDTKVAELLDRLSAKSKCYRFLPAEHHWPERSIVQATSLYDKPATEWRSDLPRPIHLLAKPERIEVSAPIPDYPPMLFRYKGELHYVAKADGPERIEQEWWLEEGLFRDYYQIEDKVGSRFWLFRSGPYGGEKPKWFIHGFFA